MDCPALPLVGEHFADSKDAFYFHRLVPDAPIPTSLSILGTEEAEVFLLRHPGHFTSLNIVCREDERGFAKILPYIGSRLTYLDIRCQGSLCLTFLEFLPCLEHVRISANQVYGLPGNSVEYPVLHTLRSMHLVTAQECVLPPQFSRVFPNVTDLRVWAHSITWGQAQGGDSDERVLPLGLERLSMRAERPLSPPVVSEIGACRGLQTLELCHSYFSEPFSDTPLPIPSRVRKISLRGSTGHCIRQFHYYAMGPSYPHLEYLDLSSNVSMTPADLCRFLDRDMPELKVLDVRGCQFLGGTSYSLWDDTDIPPLDAVDILLISDIPPLPWVQKMQNLQQVYIQPPEQDDGIGLYTLVTKTMVTEKQPEPQSAPSMLVRVPETRFHPYLIFHIHPEISFSAQSLVAFAAYLDTV